MKNLVRDLFSIPENHLFGSQEEKAAPLWHLPKPDGVGHWSAREVLEFFGTDACRSISPVVWVNAMYRRLITSEFDNIVISDVRFQNEADMLRRIGGVVIRVVKVGGENAGTTHQSGQWFQNALVDHEIVAKDPEALCAQLDELVKSW